MPKSIKSLKKKSARNTVQSGTYLDYASAAPLDPAVILAISKELKNNFANSGALHDLGVKAKKILETTRGDVAEILDAHANEIIFTSGATESNNLAIFGVVNKKNKNAFLPHIVTTNIEHASVLEVCRYLENTGKAEVTYVSVEANGVVDSNKIKKALKVNTVLVSVMYANNEIGTIQPIREIAKEIRYYNKINLKKIFFHTDATQAINYLPINVEKLGVDLLSFNGSKIYGPKGSGALFKKRNVQLVSLMHGGDQEFGLRPGTENVAGAVGLAEALKITEKIKEKETERLIKLRDYFIKKLDLGLGLDFYFVFNGDLENRLPNNVNITIPKIPSDLMVIEFSARGIYISEKSACKSGDIKGSHVIQAIRAMQSEQGLILNEDLGSLRLSLGRQTTKMDIDYTLKSLKQILIKLKKWYN